MIGDNDEMAYDDELAERLRDKLIGEADYSEKRMFGGLAFLLDGRMVLAANSQNGLMLRIDPRRSDELLADPRTGLMEMRGRELNGWLRITVDGTVPDVDLTRWVDLAVAYTRSLPPK